MENFKTLEEYMILIGSKLEKLRQNMDMTQSDVTDEVGISRKTVSSLENGSNFSVENLVKLLITYNRIEPFLNILTLPYDFDSKEYKKELKELDKEKDRIKTAYIKGIVKLDEFDNELKQIEYKRQVLEKQEQDSKQYENLNFTMDDLLLIKDKKEIEDYLHPENIIDLFVRWNYLDKTNKQNLISKYI